LGLTFLGLACVAASLPSLADQVRTINDEQHEGVATLAQAADAIKLAPVGGAQGEPLSIPLQDVVELRFSPLAHDNTAPKHPAEAADKWQIELRLQGKLRCVMTAIADDSLALQSAQLGEFSLPVNQVHAIWSDQVQMDKIDRGGEAEGMDSVYIRDKNQPDKIVSVNGRIQSLSDQSLSFVFREEARTISLDRLVGMVFAHADRPAPAKISFYQMMELAGGQLLPCSLKQLTEAQADLQLPGEAQVSVSRDQLVAMRCVNGRLIDLTRVEPTAEDAIPYFSMKIPHRVNQSFSGEPIRLFDNKTYERGLAVHSKSRLYYKLDQPGERFRATFGLMQDGAKLGNVTARVLGDGKVLWEQTDINAQSRAIPVDVDLKQAQRIILEVDFGQGQDVGDRAAWCNPVLILAEQP